jgi:hypothetical protein
VVQEAGEVLEGAGRGGDRDAVVDGSLLGRRSVGHDPLVGVLGGGGDLDRAGVADEAVECCGRAVAEEGVRSAGEHGRHRSRVWGGWEVADGVDAAMDPQQAARLDTPRDRALVEPRALKLGGRDHPVLRGGDPRDRQIGGCGEFLSPIET